MSQILNEYDANAKSYDEFIGKIEQIIEEIIRQNGFSLYEIKSRIKSRESLENKLKGTEAKYSNLTDITDVAGLRITTYFEDDVKKITALLEAEFVIDKANSINKNDLLAPDRFGYLSMHHVVSFNDDRSKLSEYQRFKGLKAEIQTRSILQHAWAEIEHDLGYKSAHEIPSNIRRRFSRLAGLLELADQEFITIRNSLEEYSKDVTEKIKSSPQDVAVNLDSLKAYILSDTLVENIDLEIASSGNCGVSNTIFSGLSGILSYFNITTIDMLNKILLSKKDTIVRFAHNWLVRSDDGNLSLGNFNKGIAIFYLGYVLAAETKDSNKIKEYLIDQVSIEDEYFDYDTLVTEVISTYKTAA